MHTEELSCLKKRSLLHGPPLIPPAPAYFEGQQVLGLPRDDGIGLSLPLLRLGYGGDGR